MFSIKDITILNNDNEYDEDSGIMEIRFLIKTPNNFNINNLYKEIYQIHGIISVSFEGNIIPHNKDIDF